MAISPNVLVDKINLDVIKFFESEIDRTLKSYTKSTENLEFNRVVVIGLFIKTVLILTPQERAYLTDLYMKVGWGNVFVGISRHFPPAYEYRIELSWVPPEEGAT